MAPLPGHQLKWVRADVKASVGKNLLQVRTYDCIISYDKHYQTPRFWLFGYDEVSGDGRVSSNPSSCTLRSHTVQSQFASRCRLHLQNKTPLTPTQVFQDVPSDHAFKTMTMEPFPHSGQQLASVHPCKHASVMKKFIDRMDEASGGAAASVAGAAGGSGAGAGVGAPKRPGGGKWGIGGMVRRVTGTGTGTGSGANKGQTQGGVGQDKESRSGSGSAGVEEEEVRGVQVDFYLVIVSNLLQW